MIFFHKQKYELLILCFFVEVLLDEGLQLNSVLLDFIIQLLYFCMCQRNLMSYLSVIKSESKLDIGVK
jgi:hypothetical protein